MILTGQVIYLGMEVIPSKKTPGVNYYKVNVSDAEGKPFQAEIVNSNVVAGINQLERIDCTFDIVQGKYPRFMLFEAKKVVK